MVFEKKNYSINFLVDPLSLLGRFFSHNHHLYQSPQITLVLCLLSVCTCDNLANPEKIQTKKIQT